jgi:hypothetical protein
MKAMGAMKDVKVQIEIDAGVIASLLTAGTLCLRDLRPLNSASKQVLRVLCLSSCVNRLQCHRLSCRHITVRECQRASVIPDR